jgi:hypothetical protein
VSRGFIPIAIAWALLASSCGYRSALPSFRDATVAATTTRAPEPALAACVTSELREGLARRGTRVRRGAALTLETELLEAGAAPGAMIDQGFLTTADQVASLVLRASLVHGGRGVVWGPAIYRVEARAAIGPGPLASLSAAELAADRACRDAAARVLADLAAVELQE